MRSVALHQFTHRIRIQIEPKWCSFVYFFFACPTCFTFSTYMNYMNIEYCKYMLQHTELQRASERNQIVDAFYILFHFVSSKLLGRTKLNLLVKWIDMSFPLCTNSNSIFQPISFSTLFPDISIASKWFPDGSAHKSERIHFCLLPYICRSVDTFNFQLCTFISLFSVFIQFEITLDIFLYTKSVNSIYLNDFGLVCYSDWNMMRCKD